VQQSFLKLRRAAVVTIAALSVGLAVFLVWHIVTPAQIAGAPLAALLGVLALMVLPGATLAAWELDRRAARTAAPAQGSDGQEPEPPPARIHERPAQGPEPRHRHRVAGERARRG
jgi:membrane protein implicated in regulation of membrane protease activity